MTGLLPGEPAPMFMAPSPINPHFTFGSLGGRYILLAFMPPPGPEREAIIALVRKNAAVFAGDGKIFFGVLSDATGFEDVPQDLPLRWFADPNGEIRRLYGAVDADGAPMPQWMLIDPSLRYMGSAPLSDGERLIAKIATYGSPDDHAGVPMHAPVLIVPRVFEPAFCRQLIDLYNAKGGEPSGVMQARGGKTIGVLNDMKKRRDADIDDEELQAQIRLRISRRLIPEIKKSFQFTATRIERYIVACYSAEEGGYFRPHRDNTTPGTAHRRFAVSINLNAEEFEGGDLRFPEFGSRTYRPPTGGAVVFSCSLLHEATPVARGVRYACLPFLYDDAAATIRQANMHTIVMQTGDPVEAPPQAAV